MRARPLICVRKGMTLGIIMNKDARIYVAGHGGMVGSALCRYLSEQGYEHLIVRSSAELDLTRQSDTEAFFEAEQPDYVFLAAARVGGIMANSTYKADFLYQNMMIAANVIEASRKSGVKKLLNLGSTCIYPRLASQPLKEESLLTGPLEPTNDAYALAKISAIKLCHFYNTQYGTDFLSVMPTNLYGPHDNYDLEKSHVLPAMIRKFYLAKCLSENNFDAVRSDFEYHDNPRATGVSEPDEAEILTILASSGIYPSKVVLWGTGAPVREFLYVDDLAEACVFLMNAFHASDIGEFVNIGTGIGHTLKDCAQMVASIVGFEGVMEWDASKPDGTPVKVTDVSRLNALGWKPAIDLEEGLTRTLRDFL